MVWIAVQIALIGYWKEIALQPVFFMAGLAITLLTLAPELEHDYKISAS